MAPIQALAEEEVTSVVAVGAKQVGLTYNLPEGALDTLILHW